MQDIKNSKNYNVRVSDLLIKLANLNKTIILKTKYLYEDEIIFLKAEYHISYENSKEIIDTIYKEYFDNIYSKLLIIINHISENISNKNYQLNDIYTLTKKEYFNIYRSNL
jgi:hypothetical protein